MTEPWIAGDRGILREYRAEDLDAVLRYAGDPEVTRYLPWGPEGAEEAAMFLDRVAAAARQVPRAQYEVAVVGRDSGDLLGGARIGVRSTPHRSGDIGYVLRRDQWGKGLGSEIARMLLCFGFESLHLHRIEATCDPGNIASRRVLEKLGMTLEGRRRDDFFVRGAWRDSLLFSILEHEWLG